MARYVLVLAALSVCVAGSAMAAPFTGGNLVITRIGDGVNSYATGVAAPVFIDEYSTTGSAVGNSVTLPTTASGGNYSLTMSQTVVAQGHLTRSVDGRYLTVFGYDAPVNTTGPSSNASFKGRTVALVDLAGNVDTKTRFEASGTAPRAAVTTNGSKIWISSDTGSGTTGGLRYIPYGSTTNGTLLTDGTFSTNDRVVNIYNGQLYESAIVTSKGVWKVGTGLPETAGQASTMVVGGANVVDSAHDFFFADANTLYVADDDTTAPVTGGLQKWTFNGTSWTQAWRAIPSGSTGVRSLTGFTYPDGRVVLFGITAESTTTAQNKLVSIFDTLGGTVAPSFGTLATAPANTVFRGVEYAVPEPATLAVLAAGWVLTLRRRAR